MALMLSTRRSPPSKSSRRPSISNPMPADRFRPLSPPTTKSPPQSPPPSKAHSRTGSMTRNWLSRASSSSSGSSVPYTPSKPVRIPEPKLTSAFDNLTQRGGVLGSGAIVVRTPQEALAGTCVSVYDDDNSAESQSIEPYNSTTSPRSPPLPPIPDFDDEEEVEPRDEQEAVAGLAIGEGKQKEETKLTRSRSATPSRPTRAPPPIPIEESVSTTLPAQNLRPSLKSFSPPTSEYFPPVPALPANIPSSPPMPLFEPILLSPTPAAIDPTKIIVTLETCTATYRTTFQTLTSRPSFLSTYLKSLLPAKGKGSRERDDDEASMSDAESFSSVYHHHLTSSGFLSQSSTNMHIFLDRPSAPYAHILTYLRTPPSTPEHPATLPRAVQLTSSSNSRLDALLELRDEARYLDLDELYKLCTDELRIRQDSHRNNALGLHTRALSNASVLSGRSLGTLRGTLEQEMDVSEIGERRNSKQARARSKDSGLGSNSPHSAPAKSPSPRNSDPQVSTAWHSSPPAMGNVSALQQRLQLQTRGRSETREGVSSMSSRTAPRWI